MLEWRIGYTLIEVVKLNNKFQFDIHTYSILPNVVEAATYVLCAGMWARSVRGHGHPYTHYTRIRKGARVSRARWRSKPRMRARVRSWRTHAGARLCNFCMCMRTRESGGWRRGVGMRVRLYMLKHTARTSGWQRRVCKGNAGVIVRNAYMHTHTHTHIYIHYHTEGRG